MLPAPFQNVSILTGPTGSGKTGLAIELAERLGAEIVSMDSMALYRGLDIGTAKPTREERRRVPHHLLDVLDPWETASVAWWREQAAKCCQAIEGRGRRVLLVGGTPLYLKALCYGLFEGPPADRELRQRLREEAQRLGRQVLHERLAQVDAVSAARLHPNDLHRVIRALEVWELTGRPISALQQQWKAEQGPNPFPRILCLDVPRKELYTRIDARVLHMIASGLIEETEGLRRLPRPLSPAAAQSVGYQEVFAFLAGKATLEETIVLIQARTRHIAKRQLTWFRHLPGCLLVSKELTFGHWGLTIK